MDFDQGGWKLGTLWAEILRHLTLIHLGSRVLMADLLSGDLIWWFIFSLKVHKKSFTKANYFSVSFLVFIRVKTYIHIIAIYWTFFKDCFKKPISTIFVLFLAYNAALLSTVNNTDVNISFRSYRVISSLAKGFFFKLSKQKNEETSPNKVTGQWFWLMETIHGRP